MPTHNFRASLSLTVMYVLLLGLPVIFPNPAFALSIELDLADVVGGGDGTGTGGNQGIDPRDGSIQTVQTRRLPGVTVNSFSLVSSPFIDGVFVPDGGPDEQALVPVSSTGLFVTGIADADDPVGVTFDYIWNGLHNEVRTNIPFDSVLGMHANKGITFDLNEIENSSPGFDASFFSAGFGLGIDIPVPAAAGPASLYVIVDGIIKASTTLDSPDALEPVRVELENSDRFLTLVTASNGDIAFDNTLFVDPTLTLNSVPIPSTLHLLAAGGLAGLVAWRWKTSKRN